MMQLLAAVNYLRIRHPKKRWYDVWLPLVVAAVLVGLYIALPIRPKLLGADGIVTALVELIKMLAGFYIASLAAIVGFSSPALDQVMAGDPPRLWLKQRGEWVDTILTRRRFVAYLFGYLAFLSIFLYIATVGAVTFAPSMRMLAPMVVQNLLKTGALFIFLFAYANLVSTTLLGLYYMCDRIHRGDARLR